MGVMGKAALVPCEELEKAFIKDGDVFLSAHN